MNPGCMFPGPGKNACDDIRVCSLANVSLAMGGQPTLCGWVAAKVPKVCCGLPLVLGPKLMKKVDEEISRIRSKNSTILKHDFRIMHTSMYERNEKFIRFFLHFIELY